MGKRFYILRHGLTEKPGVLLGQFDARLSAAGLQQARRVADELAEKKIECIVSSALARARETAAPVAERLGLNVDIDERLSEISYGRWDGLPWSEIERIDPDIAKRKLEDWWSATPPGGESATEFARRIEQSWNAIVNHAAATALIVAHEAVNAVLVDLARFCIGAGNGPWKPDLEKISSFRQEPGTYQTLDVTLK